MIKCRETKQILMIQWNREGVRQIVKKRLKKNHQHFIFDQILFYLLTQFKFITKFENYEKVSFLPKHQKWITINLITL